VRLQVRVLTDQYKFNSNERLTAGVFAAVMLYVFIVAYVPDLAGHMPPLCPAAWFGGYCPGCGLTRACGCLLRLSLLSAVRFNPLVLFVAPYVGYRSLEVVVGIATGRVLVSHWPHWFVMTYQFAFLGVWFVMALIRAATWICPECNSGGFGLPLEP